MGKEQWDNELAIAWAAGLFEGEGCISVVHPGPSNNYATPNLRISLNSSDEDVIRHFHRVVGAGSIIKEGDRPKNHHKCMWTWKAGKRKDARRILRDFLPYLGNRRKVKALEALNMPNAIKHGQRNAEKTHCRNGHAYTSENTRIDKRGSRRCLECQNLRIKPLDSSDKVGS